ETRLRVGRGGIADRIDHAALVAERVVAVGDDAAVGMGFALQVAAGVVTPGVGVAAGITLADFLPERAVVGERDRAVGAGGGDDGVAAPGVVRREDLRMAALVLANHHRRAV